METFSEEYKRLEEKVKESIINILKKNNNKISDTDFCFTFIENNVGMAYRYEMNATEIKLTKDNNVLLISDYCEKEMELPENEKEEVSFHNIETTDLISLERYLSD